ncbi:MAG: hypothetical protein PUK54_06385 [Firmicutes bacterium]|nr:hypothetical protein [Bacillota bacterium]MDY5856260.1 hypothetical protein [Anaerovoracaceae bacterium]
MRKKFEWCWISIVIDAADALGRFRKYIESPEHPYREIVLVAILASIASAITSAIIWAHRS